MRKLKVFLARLRTGSFKRMFMHIREIHKESGRSRIGLFLDMVWCILRYGVGYLDYHVFGFAYVRGREQRLSFMTMNDNLALVRRVNDPAYNPVFKNKLQFMDRFQAYTGRAYLDLTASDPETFRQFVEQHGTVFVKPVDDFGGHGIRKITAEEISDYEALFAQLRSEGIGLAEEAIRQHEKVNTLNRSCINTLRMVTLVKDGIPHHMYTLIRVGSGDGVVDNISSGGMYAPVWEDGKIAKPAFCDATGLYYEKHPVSGVDFVGFELPDYEAAVDMVKRAALEVEQIKYVGWDVALTVDGPVLVEGNILPGYDMCQNYHHLRDDKRGIKEKFAQFI